MRSASVYAPCRAAVFHGRRFGDEPQPERARRDATCWRRAASLAGTEGVSATSIGVLAPICVCNRSVERHHDGDGRGK